MDIVNSIGNSNKPPSQLPFSKNSSKLNSAPSKNSYIVATKPILIEQQSIFTRMVTNLNHVDIVNRKKIYKDIQQLLKELTILSKQTNTTEISNKDLHSQVKEKFNKFKKNNRKTMPLKFFEDYNDYHFKRKLDYMIKEMTQAYKAYKENDVTTMGAINRFLRTIKIILSNYFNLYQDMKQRKHSLVDIEFFNALQGNNIKKLHKILDEDSITSIDMIESYNFYLRQTALMLAVESNNLEIVKILISHSANIETQDFLGKTALILAVESNNLEIVKILISHSANTETQAFFGQTALMLARENGNKEIINILIENGADVSQ